MLNQALSRFLPLLLITLVSAHTPSALAEPSKNKSPTQLWEEEKERFRKNWDKRREEKEEAKLKAKEKRNQKLNKRQYCNALRDKKRQYDEGGRRWYELDNNGNRIFLTEKQIKSRYRKLVKNIKRRC